MDADLTCPECAGTSWIDQPGNGAAMIRRHCRACAGSGRRRPTLAEWDALRAERDELLRMVNAEDERHHRAALGDAPEPRRRLRECVERWPDAQTGDYDPRCCRFPKSCSADVYDDAWVGEGDLEPCARAALDAKEGTP